MEVATEVPSRTYKKHEHYNLRTKRFRRSEGAGPERDMISLRDGMESGWDGKFFRRRQRRRCHHPQNIHVCWKTVSFAIGSTMRDLGAILPPF